MTLRVFTFSNYVKHTTFIELLVVVVVGIGISISISLSWEGFRAGLGLGWGMDWEPLILGGVIFGILLNIWLARMVALTIREAVSGLDRKLAEALQGIIAQGIGDFEPPNPIQMALADLLKGKLAQATQADPVEILRASDGKFSG